MRKINLLYVVTKLELGGAQQYVFSFLTRLDREKFNIFLFTSDEGYLFAEAAALKDVTLEGSRFLERRINPIRDVATLCQLCAFIKKNHIDIVHTNSSKAGIIGRWAAKLTGVKAVIHTVHGWPFHEYQFPWVKFLFIAMERLTCGLTDVFIVTSESDRVKGLRNGIGTEAQYALIYIGFNRQRFTASGEGVRNELAIKGNNALVGTVACLKPQKAPLDFIRLASKVAEKNPDLKVKFLLVGDGVLRKRVERAVHRQGLEGKVILTGWRRDIPELLAAMDIFVLTSLWEGFPFAVLEAMASGRPVVATDTGALREVVDAGSNGYVVPPRAMEAMAERVSFLLRHKDKMRQMGVQAKKTVGSEFDLERMLDLTEALYLKLYSQKYAL
ncbi:MAG: glycosyltransferase family 4 protein [Candidatus Omnitrophica bacterium]|nr:glycosyltransferase family 4 protein [Candidatus Omnitrophota bacterium]